MALEKLFGEMCLAGSWCLLFICLRGCLYYVCIKYVRGMCEAPVPPAVREGNGGSSDKDGESSFFATAMDEGRLSIGLRIVLFPKKRKTPPLMWISCFLLNMYVRMGILHYVQLCIK